MFSAPHHFLSAQNPPLEPNGGNEGDRIPFMGDFGARKRKISDQGGRLPKRVEIDEDEDSMETDQAPEKPRRSLRVDKLHKDNPREPGEPPALETLRKNSPLTTFGHGCRLNGETLWPGDFVELKSKIVLRICSVVQASPRGELRLRGLPYISIGFFFPLLPRARNEIVQYLEVQHGPGSIHIEQTLEEVELSFVVRKRTVILTNRDPVFETEGHLSPLQNDDDMGWCLLGDGALTCRWKLIHTRQYLSPCSLTIELAVERLRCEEATPQHALHDSELLQRWRRPTQKDDGKPTFLDCFCGSGAVSCAARSAGLQIVGAVDKDEQACNTYQNNLGMRPWNMPIEQYCDIWPNVDTTIVHLSPPCQSWSPANTRGNTEGRLKKRAEDIKTSSHLRTILLKHHPCIVTMENTSGLWDNYAKDMWPILAQMTSLGFSIRFAVLNMADYGVPQTRNRLFVIAACPGQRLPQFPPATHSQNPNETGLQPHVGMGKALDWLEGIASIQKLTHHDVKNAKKVEGKTGPPRDKPAKTLTAKRVEQLWLHCDGNRFMTEREAATLQTFPVDYKFPEGVTLVAKQIGNAVPPVFMEKVFRSILLSFDP